MLRWKENDNIDYASRKKYKSMSAEDREKLMLELEKKALEKMRK